MSDFPMHIWSALAERDERILTLEAELTQAAASTEALEAEVAEAKRIEHQTFQDAAQINVESDKLRARIAALTEALERIADCEGREDLTDRTKVYAMGKRARAALTPEDR